MATDWAADVKKYAANADDAIIAGIVRYCGIALRNRDSSLVSFSDPKELDRVRNNFLKKKLGRTEGDDALNAAIAKVGEAMKADRTKNRVTVYYLLADHYKSLALFAPKTKAPAPAKAPATADKKPAAKTATKAAALAGAAGLAAASAKKPAAKKPAAAKTEAAPAKPAAAKKPAAAAAKAPAKVSTGKKAAPAGKAINPAKAAAATAAAGGALGLASAASAAPAAVKTTAAKAADAVADTAKAAAEGTVEAAKAVAGATADTAKAAVEVTTDTAKAAVNAVEDAAKATVGAASDAGAAVAGAAGAALAGAAALASGAAGKASAAVSDGANALTGGTTRDDDSGLGWLWWLLGLALLLFLVWWLFLRGPAEDTGAAVSAPTEAAAAIDPSGAAGADLAAAPSEGTVTIPTGAGVTTETRNGKPVVKVYFDTGKVDVAPAFDPAASGLKAWLEANPGSKLAISGYADPSGNAAFNADLAKRRAQAVLASLTKAGVPEGAAALVKPDSATDATVAKDAARRVEVVVQ